MAPARRSPQPHDESIHNGYHARKRKHDGDVLEQTKTPCTQIPQPFFILSHNLPERNHHELININLEEEKWLEAEKIKLLLLGAGESGKSTVFKQMRILYGSAKTDEDLKMYGVVVQSNIIVAIRKLCILLCKLKLEHKMDEESQAATMPDFEDVSGMTLRQAYDQVSKYLVDNAVTEPYPGTADPNDWVGRMM